jgi:hypothetical protein
MSGNPLICSQWSKTHCGKAFPCVFPLNNPVKPNDSETGKKALTKLSGVPEIWVYSTTCPLLVLSD